MADRVVWTIADGVADVRLNRPEKLNALDMAMFTALAETAATVAERPRAGRRAVRRGAVVLRGPRPHGVLRDGGGGALASGG